MRVVGNEQSFKVGLNWGLEKFEVNKIQGKSVVEGKTKKCDK